MAAAFGDRIGRGIGLLVNKTQPCATSAQLWPPGGRCRDLEKKPRQGFAFGDKTMPPVGHGPRQYGPVRNQTARRRGCRKAAWLRSCFVPGQTGRPPRYVLRAGGQY